MAREAGGQMIFVPTDLTRDQDIENCREGGRKAGHGEVSWPT